ncbi:2-C-methyl-D-erythritol 4-phosphate cytidylyltransferase [Escherichia coli]|nr:2-C-methyl-D-erythritol 4-phosphate cytidylyltransferase [Escherichia coli]
MFAPWFRRPDLAVECKRNVLSNISQSVIKPFLEHSVHALLAHPRVKRVVIAISPGDSRFAQLSLANHPQITVVDGGDERADSVLAGLKAAGDAQWVLVHDAARPCLHQDDLARLLALSETSRTGGILARTSARYDETCRTGQKCHCSYRWIATAYGTR